jgi:hypothetical protein
VHLSGLAGKPLPKTPPEARLLPEKVSLFGPGRNPT